jgi:single-strand DNA-binding protein
MTYHSVIIVGNVGRDAELRFTPAGQAVCSFPVATNRTFTKDSGEKVKETTWFRVSAWGKLAEVCNQYVKKGMWLVVDGQMTPDKDSGCPRSWLRQDGTPASSYEVKANTVRFGPHPGQPEQGELVPADESIPF